MVILLGIVSAGCEDLTFIGSDGPVTHTPTTIPKAAIKEDAAVLGGAVYAFTKKLGHSGLLGYRNGWDNQGPYGVVWTGVWYDAYTLGPLTNRQRTG